MNQWLLPEAAAPNHRRQIIAAALTPSGTGVRMYAIGIAIERHGPNADGLPAALEIHLPMTPARQLSPQHGEFG